MGRAPSKTVSTAVVPAVNEEAVRDAAQAATVYGMNLSKVLEQFGDGLPYERNRYIDKARYHMSRTAEEMLEVGRCLLVMKEAEAHGDWMICLESVGIAPRTAQAMMQVTARLANAPTSAHQLIDSIKSKSKVIELLVLDDEKIQELADGGSVAGLTLDDVDRMPVSQLRAALREAKHSSDAKDKLLADKNAKIDELSTDMFRTTPMTTPWDQKVRDYKAEIGLHFDILDEATGRMLVLNDNILQDNYGCEDDNDPRLQASVRTIATLYGDRLKRLSQALAEVMDRYDATLSGWAGELDNRDLTRSLSAMADPVSEA
jgi:hypothetical protein